MKLIASLALKFGSAVQADERPAEHGELDREFGSLRATRKVGRACMGAPTLLSGKVAA
jgi:hypothetical protein